MAQHQRGKNMIGSFNFQASFAFFTYFSQKSGKVQHEQNRYEKTVELTNFNGL